MSGSTSALDYPYSTLESNQHRTLIDGIDWVRVSVPWALDHVNCWVLSDVLIDTGIQSKKTQAVWQDYFGKTLPKQVLVTHYHPDHSGLAGWFHEQGAALLSHSIEVSVMHSIWQTDTDAYVQGFADWYRRNGVSEDNIAPLSMIGHGYRKTVAALPAAKEWTQLESGDDIELGGRKFKVMVGRGHAPSMVMLFCEDEKLLIAADQILPRISPNVSVMPGSPDQNPLASFLESLDALSALPEDTLVLPSHGDPFYGLHARIHQLTSHHVERLDRLRKSCTEPVTAAAVLPVLFERKLDAQQLSFALGEALAHLRYLVELGELTEETGAHGTVFSPG